MFDYSNKFNSKFVLYSVKLANGYFFATIFAKQISGWSGACIFDLNKIVDV